MNRHPIQQELTEMLKTLKNSCNLRFGGLRGHYKALEQDKREQGRNQLMHSEAWQESVTSINR